MIRTIALTAVAAAALAMPAVAGDNATSTSAVSAHVAELQALAAEKQVHNILASQGYTGISALDRDENGKWNGTAIKDGKRQLVSIVVPAPIAPAATN